MEARADPTRVVSMGESTARAGGIDYGRALATSATTIWIRRSGLGLDGDEGNGAGGEREDKRRCEHKHTMAIRDAIADAARRDGLNVDGEYGHCGEHRGENDSS